MRDAKRAVARGLAPEQSARHVLDVVAVAKSMTIKGCFLLLHHAPDVAVPEALWKHLAAHAAEAELKSEIVKSRCEFQPESLMVHAYDCPAKEHLAAMEAQTAISSSSVEWVRVQHLVATATI
jgi:DNA/RNA endonuclease G (NUC1)